MTGPPLSPRLAELLAVGSSSLTLGVAALARVADPLGRASFGDLAVAYREEYLNLQQQTMGARAPEPGALSGDDVRTHLGNSVLPRLAELDIVVLPPGVLWSEAAVAFAMEIWVDMSEDRQPLIQQFLDAARRAVARDAAATAPHARVGGASVLHAKHLVKAYKHRRVVNDVNVQLEQGEIVGLLGPNGAGKTTTFYMIVGLIRADEGDIALDGQDITHDADVQARPPGNRLPVAGTVGVPEADGRGEHPGDPRDVAIERGRARDTP